MSFSWSLIGDFSSVFTRFRSHVDELICLVHHSFVMFNYHQSITLVTEVVHDFGQTMDVTVMKSDGRFIENEEGLGKC